MRSNASPARSSGSVSIIGRTPVSALKRRVSSESIAVPEAWPSITLSPPISIAAGTGRGSIDAPTIISLPSGRSPPNTAAIASELVTVERIRSTPPSA